MSGDHNCLKCGGFTMNRRGRLIRRIARRIGVEEGYLMPRWLCIFACVLIPSRVLMWLSCQFYDPKRDVYTIGGVKISGRFFESLRIGGVWYRVTRRENGIVSIETKIAPYCTIKTIRGQYP
jgi:hypothetical protein